MFFPSDVLHVLAASVWVGGIACLLLALPAATRELESPDRSRLLLATLTRFSPMALAAVIVIALTGVVQAYIDVRSLNGLLHSTYGALIIAKTAATAGVDLARLGQSRAGDPCASGGSSARASRPARAGILARRTMRGELALMLAVFGVTAALITYAPPIDASSGPFSTNTTLGPAELEMTVEPAKVGLNTVHLYLIDAKTRRAVHGDQGTDRHGQAPVQGHRPAHATRDGGGARPLHPQLRRAQPGRYLGNPDHRPGLGIRIL